MNTLQDQWQTMLEKNIIPVIEYQITKDDWLLVNISIEKNGLCFNFDDEFTTHFGGDVYKKGCSYMVKFDQYFEDLDYYFQLIDIEMAEGYLIPNNLYYYED